MRSIGLSALMGAMVCTHAKKQFILDERTVLIDFNDQIDVDSQAFQIPGDSILGQKKLQFENNNYRLIFLEESISSEDVLNRYEVLPSELSSQMNFEILNNALGNTTEVELEKVQQKIAHLEDQVQANESKYQESCGQVNQLSKDIDKAKEIYYLDLQQKQQENEAKLNELNLKLAQIERESEEKVNQANKDTQTQIVQLQVDQTRELSKKEQEYTNKLKDVESKSTAQIEVFQKELTALKDELTQVSGKVGQANQKAVNLELAKQQLEAQISEVQAQLSVAQASVAAKDSNIQTLEAEKTALNSKVAQIEQELADAKTKFVNEETKFKSLELEKNKLADQVSKIKSDLETTENTIGLIQAEKSAVDSQVLLLTSQLEVEKAVNKNLGEFTQLMLKQNVYLYEKYTTAIIEYNKLNKNSIVAIKCPAVKSEGDLFEQLKSSNDAFVILMNAIIDMIEFPLKDDKQKEQKIILLESNLATANENIAKFVSFAKAYKAQADDSSFMSTRSGLINSLTSEWENISKIIGSAVSNKQPTTPASPAKPNASAGASAKK